MALRLPISFAPILIVVLAIQACAGRPSPQGSPMVGAPSVVTSTPSATVTVTSPTASPTAEPTAIPTPVVPALSCDIVVHGWQNLHLQPCLPPSRVQAGSYIYDAVWIDINDPEYTGVNIAFPPYLLRHGLKPGKYVMADYNDGPDTGIVAGFIYYDAPSKSFFYYSSYSGGKLILPQTGQYLSGSFSFGARSDEGRQINVDGTFENVPFSPVNIP